MMGSPEGEWGRESNETQSEQTIDKDYYIGIYEVTMAQQYLITGNLYKYKNNATSNFWGPEFPAVYNDVENFISTLSAGAGKVASLPTEAQWEYACRAGVKDSVYTGVSPTTDVSMMIELAGRESVGHYRDGSSSLYRALSDCDNYVLMDWGALPVGTLLPNPWGLYDMLGNRGEMCANNISKGASAWSSPSLARAARKGDTTSPDGGSSTLTFRIVIAE